MEPKVITGVAFLCSALILANIAAAGPAVRLHPPGSRLDANGTLADAKPAMTGYVIEPPVDRSGVPVHVGPNVRISRAYSTWMHSEMHIAADPLNYRKLIACSIMGSSYGMANERDIVYSSDDQGLTWTPRVTVDSASDPTCAYSSQGTALFAAIAILSKNRHDASEIYRSLDGGSSWAFASTLTPLDNPGFATGVTDSKLTVWIGGVDLRRLRKGSEVLVASRSFNDAENFSRPLALTSPLPGYSLTVAGTPATFSDGAPIYPVLEIRSPALDSSNQPGKANAQLGIARIGQRGVVVSYLDNVYSNFTADWATVKSVLATDRSRDIYHNRLYAAWPDWRTGRSEVLVAYSDNRGTTWSTPRIINDDHAFGDTRFGPDDTQVMLAVNRNGLVGVAWYSRAASKDDLGWTVRFRASLDGGNTWLPSVQVSSDANTFGVPRNWSNNFSVLAGHGVILIMPGYHAAQFFTGGDYSGMTADAAGAFHPVWSDNRTGISQMWTAQVRVPGGTRRTATGLNKISYILPTEEQLPPVPWPAFPHETPEAHTVPDVRGISGIRYDPLTQEFSFNVRLKNDSSQSMHGPWQLYIEDIQSSYGESEVTHDDNRHAGAGARWTFHGPHNDVLRPGELSEARRIFIRLSHERPFNVTDFWAPGRLPEVLASVRYRIQR